MILKLNCLSVPKPFIDRSWLDLHLRPNTFPIRVFADDVDAIDAVSEVYCVFSDVYAGCVVWVVRDFFEMYPGVAGEAKGKSGFVVVDMLGASF
jgi:hypothetical protein